jgi:hypothetical protein
MVYNPKPPRAQRPTPDAQRPTPDAQRPTPNAQAPKARPQLALRCTWRNGERNIVVYTNEASECLIEATVRWHRRQPAPRGRPCRAPNVQRPTPNVQRPGTRDSAAASHTLHLAQRRAYYHSVHEHDFRMLHLSRRKVASSPVDATGAALPHAPRPTPKRPQRLTPNANVTDPFGWSTAQLCWCYGSLRRRS